MHEVRQNCEQYNPRFLSKIYGFNSVNRRVVFVIGKAGFSLMTVVLVAKCFKFATNSGNFLIQPNFIAKLTESIGASLREHPGIGFSKIAKKVESNH